MSAGRPLPQRVDVLGIQIDPLRIDEAVDSIAVRAADVSSPAVYVVKPYVEMIDLALRDASFAVLLNGAWLCLADGVALQWAAALRAQPPGGAGHLLRSLVDIVRRPGSVASVLPERVAGLSLTEPLLRRCAEDGLTVHLVGSPKHQSLEEVARLATRRFAGLRITGTAPGDIDSADQLLASLRALRPDVVLVGMGFPRQERLIAWLAPRLEHGVLLGEGGSFDYREFGGGIRRAPATVRGLGLEWLWRLLREPRRLRRQLAIPRFIWRTWRWSLSAPAPR